MGENLSSKNIHVSIRVVYPMVLPELILPVLVLGTGTGIFSTQYIPDCYSGYRDFPDTYPATHPKR